MTKQYLAIHMTDKSGTAPPGDDGRRMLDRWVAEGERTSRLGDGAPVAGPEDAKSVMLREGEVLITDGPFPEFKEWFAGYDLIRADSIEEAAEYMVGHPMALQGRILLLPIVPLPWEQQTP